MGGNDKKYSLITVEPAQDENSVSQGDHPQGNAVVQENEQAQNNQSAQIDGYEQDTAMLEAETPEVLQKESLLEQEAAAHESAVHEPSQETCAPTQQVGFEYSESQPSTTKPTRAQRIEAKKEFNAKIKQEYEEELGTEKDVPFSRMRIFIIVLLVLFIIGFVIYYACST